MYLYRTIQSLVRGYKRKYLLQASKAVSSDTKKNRLFIQLDMIYSSLRFGAMFTEYEDLKFVYRSNKNRSTFLTTYYDYSVYDKVNDRQFRGVFHNKTVFLETFKKFVGREWINIKENNDEAIRQFLIGKDKIVAKDSWGDSGSGVELIDVKRFSSSQELIKYCRESKYDLLEECISNHPDVASYNPSSLNTVRIVTININNNITFIFAGLRVGAKGSSVDNISQGGKVARIDLDTGYIDTPFYRKQSSNSINIPEMEQSSIHLRQLPLWNELLDYTKNLAKTIPQMGFVAWDIAITPKGPEVIEGNESFGCVVMQLFYGIDECGLKQKVEECLNAK